MTWAGNECMMSARGAVQSVSQCFIHYFIDRLSLKMTEQVDYDSDTQRGGRDSSSKSSAVQIKGRGKSRLTGGGERKGRGGVFETIEQSDAEAGGPAQCECSSEAVQCSAMM